MPNKSVYLDSCVVIDYLQGSKGKHPERLRDIDPIIEEAKSQKFLIVVSALAVAEVVRCNPDGEPTSTDDDRKIRQFFQKEYIDVRPLTRDLAHAAREIVRAAKMRGDPKLTPHDAVHIATAIECKSTILYTYDDTHLLPQDGKNGNPWLPIRKPNAAEGTIFQVDDEEV